MAGAENLIASFPTLIVKCVQKLVGESCQETLVVNNKLKVARETVEAMRFERVHRTPSQPVRGKVRTIVAKFTFFKNREKVRRQWPDLQAPGTIPSIKESIYVARHDKTCINDIQ